MTGLKAGSCISFEGSNGRREAHIFDEKDVPAIEAARLTGRPLLLKGDPGVGKSQLARATAEALNLGFRSKVVDAATEARDLLWEEDLVERLAEAQALGVLRAPNIDNAALAELSKVREQLDIRKFIVPGVLWWGFNPKNAEDHLKTFRANAYEPSSFKDSDRDGMVVLIDEIDKADSDVPNGLLEALGASQFRPRGCDTVAAVNRPLVIITTNQERPLPQAFLRRCIVHEIQLPKGEALHSFLVERGEAHFEGLSAEDRTSLHEAARQTLKDRAKADEMGLRPLPGQAEFIDLLHAMFSEEARKLRTPNVALEELAPFILRKHKELKE